ncbi:11428_t:CDS:2 [Cetraspora pellucida]|uniref:11428_t:CDS:1 n=1 Tax=Cetraspora pellucida TaxID=1433469 RepID=A0ACA9LPI7_9GLOM|nr:11428_t:CDS:2 [Cetraspora pellucida]
MWAKIFSDTFLINSDNIDVNWEFHHQIPSNGESRSARSDFAAVDEIVVTAEAAFEYNRILTAAYYLSKDEVNSSCLHIRLINETTIHLGSMKSIYNKEKKFLIYVYEKDNVTFKLYIGNQEADIEVSDMFENKCIDI